MAYQACARAAQVRAGRRPHLALVAPHALGERKPRERIQPENALRGAVVIGNLHALQQLAPRLRLRHVELAQQPAAMLRALDRFAHTGT
jgi:hypothetical protein